MINNTLDKILAMAEKTKYCESWDITSEIEQEIIALSNQFIDDLKALGYQTEETKHAIRLLNLENEHIADKLKKYQFQMPDGTYAGFVFEDLTSGTLYDSIQSIQKDLGDNYIVQDSRKPYGVSGFREDTQHSIYVKEIDSIVKIISSTNVTLVNLYMRDGTNIEMSANRSYKSNIEKGTDLYGDKDHSQSFANAVCDMFGKKFPLFHNGAMNYEFVGCPYKFEKLNKDIHPQVIKASKQQEKIDEFLENYTVSKDIPVYGNSDRFDTKTKIAVEALDDDLTVVRWIMQYNDYSVDYFRIYVEGNKAYACKINNDENYVYTDINKIGVKNFQVDSSCKFEFIEKSSGMLRYYKDIVNNVPENIRGAAILSYIVNPHLEQMCKLGYMDLFISLFDANGSVENTIKKTLMVNKNQKQFFKWIGLSQKQLDYLTQSYAEDKKAVDCNDFNIVNEIKQMKILADMCSLNDLDEKTFQYLHQAAKGRFIFREKRERDVKEDDAFIAIIHKVIDNQNNPEKKLNFIKSCAIINDEEWYNNLAEAATGEKQRYKYLTANYNYSSQFFEDYIYMLSEVEDNNVFPILPKTQREFAEAHDALINLYNLHAETKREGQVTCCERLDQANKRAKDAQINKNFAAQIEKIKKYEYENDGYKVIAPISADQLIIEGMKLHHCVASYVKRIANGETNVMFIRSKERPDEPFFTVEVDNERVIKQAHGFGNCNTDYIPGLTDFVNKWAEDKKLIASTMQKIR